MAAFEKVQVIAAFKPFLRMLSVYNSENFDYSHSKISLNIFLVLCIIAFTAMQILMCTLLFWFWVDENFSLSSRVVSTCICGIQMAAINISMKLNNRKISEMVDYTRIAIEPRNSHFVINYKNVYQYD